MQATASNAEMGRRGLWLIAVAVLMALGSQAQPFMLPTPNVALLQEGPGESYFVPTPGRTWQSGTFGCVRSGGTQMHEGLDIRPVERDRRGEPADDIYATTFGKVVYANRRSALSNYGIYLVLQHLVDGIEIYSLYAHLAEIRPDLKPGMSVSAGEIIGRMGRTANTRQSITRDRAHLHFELNLLLNDNFSHWYKKRFPGQRNDHGEWNGQNFAGIDAGEVFLRQQREGRNFDLSAVIRQRTELCRVLVRRTSFPWLKRYPALVRPNPTAETEGVVGYEIALDFNGVAFELTPRAASEIPAKARSVFQLLSVNEAEQRKNPARQLVTRRGSQWQLSEKGTRLLELLTF